MIGSKPAVSVFQALAGIETLEEIYANYNEIEKPKDQEEIFKSCLSMPNLKKIEIKGNEIKKSLYNKFKADFENKKDFNLNCYSEEEEEFDDEEDVNELENKMEDLDINKK